MPRAIPLAFVAVTLVAACSGGTPQSSALGEYAQELERLLSSMQAAISVSDTGSSRQGIDAVRTSFDGQLAALDDFISGLRALEPPEAFAADHAKAIADVQDLRDATKALVDIAQSVDTLSELEVAMQGAPIETAEEASARAWERCWEAQAAFTKGVERTMTFTTPWLETADSEPIQVNLGCFVSDG